MSPLLEVAAAVTLILGCVTAVGVMLSRLWRGIRKLVKVGEVIDRELNPNGGGSTYDLVRVAAASAERAETKAKEVASDLSTFRGHQAVDSAQAKAALAQVQHDLTNVRAGQELLLSEVDKVRDTAKKATKAAAAAVEEAQAGRSVVAAAADNAREQIADLREATDALTTAMADDQRERVVKERAYISALNKIGVPLLPIADELES